MAARVQRPKTVHPRVRGEHGCGICSFFCPRGSSPRARGTLRQKPLVQPHRRFIPACAGNTLMIHLEASDQSVHPRVRGEHGNAGMSEQVITGSSPRARGTPVVTDNGAVNRRFIPACAGNTRVIRDQYTNKPVHPRVRGEHAYCWRDRMTESGSSPRARGTLLLTRRCHLLHRFIPACAGNTRISASASALSRGSSPRARGTHYNAWLRYHETRFIPACAGNTPSPQ